MRARPALVFGMSATAILAGLTVFTVWNSRTLGPAAPILASSPTPTPRALPPAIPAEPPPSPAGAPTSARIGDIPDDLRARRLSMPLPGVSPAALSPQFYDARGERGHEALDIMAAKDTPVMAVEDGVIAKLFLSQAGGVTIYQFDPTGSYAYYYAHLDHYASDLAEGQAVKRGQVIAFVGMTGNAPVPHLHFGIFRLGPEKHWWQGEPLDPYPALTGR